MMDVAGEAEGWLTGDLGWTPSAMFLLPFLLFVQVYLPFLPVPLSIVSRNSFFLPLCLLPLFLLLLIVVFFLFRFSNCISPLSYLKRLSPKLPSSSGLSGRY